MFSLVLMPLRIRAIALACASARIAMILVLVITTVIWPGFPVLAEEELAAVEQTPSSLISDVEQPAEPVLAPPLEADTELESVDDLSAETPLEPLPAVESTAEPMVALTPEQTLILALQTHITELTRPYSDEQVESIQISLAQRLLRLEISEDWYQFNDKQQDEIANKLFDQAQKLAFKKLEILNDKGQLIARNPVIGKQMIILDRHRD